jgi:L-ribulose-5-phosphate 4-epimerase
MMLAQLKEAVWRANLDLVEAGLVVLTWGNASGIIRSEGLIVIKPSGVDYAGMTVDDMVVVDLDGRPVEGSRRPSSDTPTHCALYRAFPEIGGIVHTHSACATVFAQACRDIPCLGTTHADHFAGPVPVTRFLTEEEVAGEYERNTGRVIVERFANVNPVENPAVLVAGHAPFCWGTDVAEAVRNSVALERIAGMALDAIRLAPDLSGLPPYILRKHFERKHGPRATYGQR